MDAATNSGALILGVGNILLKDEGLGVRAVEWINSKVKLPDGVLAVDGGTSGLKLLPLFKEYDRIVIIDAVASTSGPGTVCRIPAEKLKTAPPLMATAHEIDIGNILALAALEGYNPEVVIIGMEPADINPGLELSAVVEKKIPEVVELVMAELDRFGFKP